MRNFERSKTRRSKGSGVRRSLNPFSVATPSPGPQPDESAPPSDEDDSFDGVGLDGGPSTNYDSDVEPRRYNIIL